MGGDPGAEVSEVAAEAGEASAGEAAELELRNQTPRRPWNVVQSAP